ncbi:exported hypothetical protein [uncultured Thiomicrorhabdus sp.]
MNLLKAFAALKQLRFFSLIISFSLAMPLVAISAVQGVQAAESDLVVYSSRKEHLLKPLTDAYTKLTGVKITLYTGKEGALIERLKAEGAETQADVLMLADAGNLGYAAQEGLFQPLNSPLIEKNIPANLRPGNSIITTNQAKLTPNKKVPMPTPNSKSVVLMTSSERIVFTKCCQISVSTLFQLNNKFSVGNKSKNTSVTKNSDTGASFNR